MKRSWMIIGSLLCATPAVADAVFDAAYVSKPSVCDRFNEGDFVAVLTEEDAWAVFPSKGLLGGALVCYFHDQREVISGAWSPERLVTARCMGDGTSRIDQLAMAQDSYAINVSVGGNAHGYPLGSFIEVVSMRDESYAGVYTRCDNVQEQVLEWFD